MRHYLCDKIRAERHLDYLRSRRILTRDDAEEISCRTTQTKRTAMLLDILAENPRGLDALTDSIRDMRSQNFIIAKITDEVQKAKSEKIESLRGKLARSHLNLKFKIDLKKCIHSVCKYTLHLSLHSRGIHFLIRQQPQLSNHNHQPLHDVFKQLHAAIPPGRREKSL